MRIRVWLWVGAIVAGLVLVFGGVRNGWGDEEPQADAEAGPPSITYGGSRTSSAWVGLPGKPRVAVGKGVQWRGVKVYLSLTWDLVGVDATSGKTLYVTNVGAFWNAFSFSVVTPKDGEARWAVELRSHSRRRSLAARRQYHDLRTGRKLDVPGLVGTPPGQAFRPRANGYGDKSRIAKRFALIATTEANWKTVRERLLEPTDRARFGTVDFTKEVVLVVSSGNGWNCRGIDVEIAYEDDARILLRTNRHFFQTIGGGHKARPWGVFVLPRRPGKAYHLEHDVQGLIGGPAIWKRVLQVERLPAPEKELAGLPAASDVPHHGPEQDGDRPAAPPPR